MSYATELSCHYAVVRRRLAPEPPPRIPRHAPRPEPRPEPKPKPKPKPAPAPKAAPVPDPELVPEAEAARFVRAVLGKLGPLQQRTSWEIVRAAARESGLTTDQLLEHGRTHDRVRPRQIAMAICVLGLHRSLPPVGRLFNGRHHTTILHAVRKWRDVVEPIIREHETSGLIKQLVGPHEQEDCA